MKKLQIISLILLFSIFSFGKSNQYESSYTSIDEHSCSVKKVYENGMGAMSKCENFGSIGVGFSSDDGRDELTLFRNNKSYNLDISQTITPLFTQLGKKIEWRYPKGQKHNPKSIIVRLNIDIEGETQKDRKRVSYLIVSKITKNRICIVEKVAPQKNQNQIARDISNRALSITCLSDNEINKKIYN